MYNSSNDAYTCISKSNCVVCVKYVNHGKLIAVITHSPLCISVLDSTGSLLWGAALPYIESPVLAHTTHSHSIAILDTANNKIYTITN